MRKDVKLGLAVGGVLVAVLVVYVLVVPGGSEPGADLALVSGDSESQPAFDIGGAGSTAESANAGATPSESQQGPSASQNSTPEGDQPKQEPPAGNDASSPEPKDEVAANAPRTSGGFDWEKLLNGNVPSMSAETPVATVPPDAVTPNHAGAPQPPAAQAPVGQPPVTTVADAAPQEHPAPEAAPGNNTLIDTNIVRNREPAATVAEGAPEPEPTVAGGQTYVVKPNETLSSISAAAYGNANYYPHIMRANPNLDPTKIRPGTKITLPPASAVKPSASLASARIEAEKPVDSSTEYKVQPNDSLYKISKKLYGKSTLADAIYELNRDAIGEDPAHVKVGMVLKLPEAPAQTASR